MSRADPSGSGICDWVGSWVGLVAVDDLPGTPTTTAPGGTALDDDRVGADLATGADRYGAQYLCSGSDGDVLLDGRMPLHPGPGWCRRSVTPW